MKKIKQVILTIIAVTLTVTAACTRDEAEQFPVAAAADSFSLDISFGKPSPSTRATTITDEGGVETLNENKITKLDIFFYQGTTLKWHAGNVTTYDVASKKATIPITTGKRTLFENNTTTSYDIYVVANNTADVTSIAEEADNLEALKTIVFQSADFVSKGGNEAQTAFVMDGKITKVVNLNSPDLGTVDLKRAASKIRLTLTGVNVPGYTQDGQASASLVNFTDKSHLLDGTQPVVPGNNEWRETSQRAITVDGTTAAPFYTYANDWNSETSRETYIELFIPLKNNDDGVTKSYKYRIPLTPRTADADETQHLNKLERNFLYDISTTIRILGSIAEVPVKVSGDYIIKNWDTQEVFVNIQGSHYLVVSERNVIMPNITSYTLTFNSSIPNVTLVPGSLKATYTYVSTSTGQPVTENVAADQMPTVMVAAGVASGNITITSPIPVNFIPKDIEFKITNGTLTETVTIQQLPPTYFTVTKGVSSYLPDEGSRTSLPSGNNNPYMYAVTTLAPAGDIIWGFPPTDSQGQTINSEEVSKMVSPKFEMASQFGATLTKSYANGQKQCRGYTETAEDGTVKTGWRLPTAAEIHYIDAIQQTAPTKYVMRGAYYWSNWDKYPTQDGSSTRQGAYKMGVNVPPKNHDDSYNTGASYNSAHVRCIRDIKD